MRALSIFHIHAIIPFLTFAAQKWDAIFQRNFCDVLRLSFYCCICQWTMKIIPQFLFEWLKYEHFANHIDANSSMSWYFCRFLLAIFITFSVIWKWTTLKNTIVSLILIPSLFIIHIFRHFSLLNRKAKNTLCELRRKIETRLNLARITKPLIGLVGRRVVFLFVFFLFWYDKNQESQMCVSDWKREKPS